MARKLKNWLKAYNEYTNAQESPPLFHMWVGLNVLSAAVQRRISVHQGYFTTYPNLYCVLSAIPGRQKKSTAMDIGRELLEHVPGIRIAANKLTTESLINMLAQASVAGMSAEPNPEGGATIHFSDSAVAIWNSELATMFSRDAYKSGLVTLLTDLFTCHDKWNYQTISRGVETLRNVYITLFGAVTPDVLRSNFSEEVVGSGFPSRLLIVGTEDNGPLNPRPKMTPRMLRLKDDLINDLIYISGLTGSLDFDNDSGAFWDDWYTTDRLDVPHNLSDQRFAGYLERRHVHLTKLTALVGLSFEDINKLDIRHLGIARDLLSQLELTMHLPFKNSGESPNISHYSRIRQQLIAHGGKLLVRDFVRLNINHIPNTPQMDDVMKIMERAGFLKLVRGTSGNPDYYLLCDMEPETLEPTVVSEALESINGTTTPKQESSAIELRDEVHNPTDTSEPGTSKH